MNSHLRDIVQPMRRLRLKTACASANGDLCVSVQKTVNAVDRAGEGRAGQTELVLVSQICTGLIARFSLRQGAFKGGGDTKSDGVFSMPCRV